MAGQVVHFEVPAGDIERAKAFYAEAFGWQMQSVPQMSYTLVTTTPTGETGPTEPGAINGGMMERSGPVQAPIITIMVDDIDDTLATVQRLGGRAVAGPDKVGDMGFAAYFVDPEGNTMGLWQSVS